MNSVLHVQVVAEKGEWEAFLLAQPSPSFLQSWNSKTMTETLGHPCLPLGLYEQGTLIGICLVEEVRAKRGNYLAVPYGPVLKEWRKEYLQAFTAHLRAYASEHGFDFLRFASFIEDSQRHRDIFASCGFQISPIHLLAETLWVLDIGPDEGTLLKNMRKTTRNLVRRAIKDQVTITFGTDASDVDQFIALHKETEARHQFVAYSADLFKAQVEAFSPDHQVSVLRADHQEQTLAAAIIMYYGDMASYHHGASLQSKVPAAYLVQWEAILEAKRRGCTTYNFWGITESEDKKHPFYGLSYFKKGFGGRVVHLLPCQDLPLTSRYTMTRIIETIRRIRRGFGLKRA